MVGCLFGCLQRVALISYVSVAAELLGSSNNSMQRRSLLPLSLSFQIWRYQLLLPSCLLCLLLSVFFFLFNPTDDWRQSSNHPRLCQTHFCFATPTGTVRSFRVVPLCHVVSFHIVSYISPPHFLMLLFFRLSFLGSFVLPLFCVQMAAGFKCLNQPTVDRLAALLAASPTSPAPTTNTNAQETQVIINEIKLLSAGVG